MEEIGAGGQQNQLAKEFVPETIEPEAEAAAVAESPDTPDVLAPPERQGRGGYGRLIAAIATLAVIGLRKDEPLTEAQIAENLRLALEEYNRLEAERQAEIEAAVRKDARHKSARREGGRGNN